jgi:hypothetical protein
VEAKVKNGTMQMARHSGGINRVTEWKKRETQRQRKARPRTCLVVDKLGKERRLSGEGQEKPKLKERNW